MTPFIVSSCLLLEAISPSLVSDRETRLRQRDHPITYLKNQPRLFSPIEKITELYGGWSIICWKHPYRRVERPGIGCSFGTGNLHNVRG